MGLLRPRPPRVGKLERKQDAPGLVRALAYEDPVTDRDGRLVDLGAGVRVAALEALTRLDTPLVHDAFATALADPEESVREAAVGALQTRGDEAAVETLAAVAATWTGSQHVHLRASSVEALVNLGRPAVLTRVAAALVMRPEALEDADADVIRRLRDVAGPGEVSDAIASLVDALADPDKAERARSLLVWLGADSVDRLVRALREGRAQREASLALGAIHDSRAVEALCELLGRSREPRIREAAAWALGEIRDPSAIEALLVATGDPDFEVRAAASSAFDRLGNAAIAMALSALVRRSVDNGAGVPSVESGRPPDPAKILPQLTSRAEGSHLAERARPLLRRLFGS